VAGFAKYNIPLGNGVDDIPWKLGAEQVLEFKLKNFALKLLRALLGPTPEFGNLVLHVRDLLITFAYPKPEVILDFLSGLVANSPKCFLYARLDRQIHFPPRIANDVAPAV